MLLSARCGSSKKEFHMASLNKWMGIGNLGKDPELRYTASGTAVASFSLATSDRIKNKDGEWEEKTEWHSIVLWARLAEIAGEYLSKGKTIYIEGRLQTRKWQDKDGKDRYTNEIVGEKMQMLSGKGENSGSQGGQRQNSRQGSQQSNRDGGQGGEYDGGGYFPDDSIPF